MIFKNGSFFDKKSNRLSQHDECNEVPNLQHKAGSKKLFQPTHILES